MDALVVADDERGVECARNLRARKLKAMLAFAGAVFPNSGEPRVSQLRRLAEEGVVVLLEMTPVTPLLDAVKCIAGWVFLSRSGYLAIHAKMVFDATAGRILDDQSPSGLGGDGPLKPSDRENLPNSLRETALPLSTCPHYALQPVAEELLWCYESPRYMGIHQRVPFALRGGATETMVDVLVVGGGTAGAAAAIAAAREGVHVICAEALDVLGGPPARMPQGEPAPFTPCGFAQRCAAHAATGNLADWLRQEARQAGVEVWWNTRLGGVLRSKRKITGALLVDGRGVMRLVHAKVVVDATGNALVAMAAGAPASSLTPDAPSGQGVGGISLGTIRLNAYTQKIPFCEGDALDVTRMRLRLLDHSDGGDRHSVGERFRIVGDLTVQPHDIILSRHYRDAIGLARGSFGTTGSEAHSLLLSLLPAETTWEAWLPLRALLPLKLDGLLTTGLGISVHWDALSVLGHPGDLQNLGYASGLVAAAAAHLDRPLREVPLRPIQQKLVEEGILPTDALMVTDDENSATLTPERMTLYQAAVIFQRPDRARRQLQAVFEHHPTLLVAEILAFLGDSSGRDLLKQILHSTAWERNFPGTVNTPLDCAILALRIIGGGAMALLRKLQELDAASPFSHLRAVCLYLQRWPSKEAIPQLERILTSPGFAGHAASPDDEAALMQLRELYVAGALKACSPDSELATASLTAYRNSPCLLHAVYAEKLLRQN